MAWATKFSYAMPATLDRDIPVVNPPNRVVDRSAWFRHWIVPGLNEETTRTAFGNVEDRSVKL